MSEKENAVEKNKKNTGKTNKNNAVRNNKSTYEKKPYNANTRKNDSKSVQHKKTTKVTQNSNVNKATSNRTNMKNKAETKDGKNVTNNRQKNTVANEKKVGKTNNVKNVQKKTEIKSDKKNIDKLEKKDKMVSKTSTNNTTKDTIKEVEKSSVAEEKELVELNKKKKVKEDTIIQKIKNFLAKIAEMQEEAKKEINEIKENVKIKKEKVELEKNKEENTKIQTNYLLEYYDLPYRYNETVVKILAQTPKKLFVYWDISDEDKLKYIKSFGDNFFADTYPVLLLYNEEKKYVKEIAINDFANSWYIDIDDPKTKYTIQLGRKFRKKPEIINMTVFKEEKIILQTDYLPIAMSNKIEVPNDHILFEKFNSKVLFRNVKTNQEVTKDIRTFDKKLAKAYDLNSFYDMYEELYKDGIENGMFDLNNPTSGNTSSSFK